MYILKKVMVYKNMHNIYKKGKWIKNNGAST